MEELKTLGDVSRRLCKLLEDPSAAEIYLKENNSQFARRAYIRSVFAYMEGAIWLFKQLSLQAVLQSRAAQPLSSSELALLTDISYDLKDNGEPYEQQKNLPLPKNLRFTINVINKLTGASINLETDSASWSYFKEILQVRHRITHPKNVSEVDITDEEIERAIKVCGWFNSKAKDCLPAFQKRIKRRQS